MKGGSIILPKGVWLIIGVVLLTFPSAAPSYARELPVGENVTDFKRESLIEIDWEHFVPVRSNRQIETDLIHVFKSFGSPGNDRIAYFAGLTLTYARGELIRNQSSFNCSAWGIGPMAVFRYTPLQLEKWSLAFDLSGGLIFYNKDFPTGGDCYNFMWRVGPKFSFKLRDNLALSLGYHLMHVSNGQPNHNPGYDAKGPVLGMRWAL